MNHLLLNCSIFFSTAFLYFQAMTCTIDISGFDSNEGKAFVEIIDEKGKTVSQLVLPIANKKVSKSIALPRTGKYGFRAFHDENNNQKLDKNLVGYPTEKWGVSNGIRPAFRAPTTNEILVKVDSENDLIKINLE